MGSKTRIRWAGSTWGPFSGCERISPGCDACYAEAFAERFRGTAAYPNGFEPFVRGDRMWQKPYGWRSEPRRVFVNSMSDTFHDAFDDATIDRLFDVMLDVPEHDYLILTKRPRRMARYLLGPAMADFAHRRAVGMPGLPNRAVVWPSAQGGAYLQRRDLSRLPDNIWVGTSIENDRYAWRADWLRAIPATVRFLSCEPLLGPLPTLNLANIGWVIVGGESGNNSNGYRPMDHAWAADLRDRADMAGTAFFFKQSAGPRTETGIELDGRRWEQFPFPHPATIRDRTALLGRYTDDTENE